MSNDRLQEKEQKLLLALIQQAGEGKPVSYQDLGRRLKRNHRLFGPPLDIVGSYLQAVCPDVPALTAIVVYKKEKLPPLDGVAKFLKPTNRSKEGMRLEMRDVYAYDWSKIAKLSGRLPSHASFDENGMPQNNETSSAHRGGGEREAHKALKEDVFENPKKYGLFGFSLRDKSKEQLLPSGDFLDVYFENDKEIVGVEVKSHSSDKKDMERGIYQCIKYQAVLDAQQEALSANDNCTQKPVRTFLVVGKALPANLRRTAKILDVEVMVAPKESTK